MRPHAHARGFSGGFADSSAKLRKNIEILGKIKVKYLLSVTVVLLMVQFAFGIAPAMRLSAESYFATTQEQDTTRRNNRRARRANNAIRPDSTDTIAAQSSLQAIVADSIATDTTKKAGATLDNIITGSAADSLYYDMRNKMVYIYTEGDVTYDNMNLKADFMNINLDSKNIYA